MMSQSSQIKYPMLIELILWLSIIGFFGGFAAIYWLVNTDIGTYMVVGCWMLNYAAGKFTIYYNGKR